MEIIFLVVSIVITIGSMWVIGRLVYPSNQKLLQAYKTSFPLITIHFIFGVMMMSLIFLLLAAFNNTFWHLPYLFV